LYSFFPGSRVRVEAINSDVSSYDLICLGSPKWTFSCPPFNEYLHMLRGCRGKRFVLFATFGGFRERDFTTRIISSLKRKGASSISVLTVERRHVHDGAYIKLVDDFSALLWQKACEEKSQNNS
jgi:hypothetical protein